MKRKILWKVLFQNPLSGFVFDKYWMKEAGYAETVIHTHEKASGFQ